VRRPTVRNRDLQAECETAGRTGQSFAGRSKPRPMKPLCGSPHVGATERLTGVVVQGPMTTPPALIGWCALAVAWMTAGTVYLYPGLKEEVDEKRYIHRVEKLHTPVLPFCRVVQVVPVVPLVPERRTTFERGPGGTDPRAVPPVPL
jgi:hypothetical protein